MSGRPILVRESLRPLCSPVRRESRPIPCRPLPPDPRLHPGGTCSPCRERRRHPLRHHLQVSLDPESPDRLGIRGSIVDEPQEVPRRIVWFGLIHRMGNSENRTGIAACAENDQRLGTIVLPLRRVVHLPRGQKPSRRSCLALRCQSLATRTCRSRYTGVPSSASIPVRACLPISRSLDPLWPMMIPF